MRNRFHPAHFTACLRRGVTAALGFLVLSSAGLRAESVDYSTDRVLVETRVDTTPLDGKSVTLAEVFALVESQTNLRFLYVPERVPADGRFTLGTTGVMSLTKLLSTLSFMAKVVFERDNRLVIVRSPIPDAR
jgi:hypothetical protein